MILLQDYLRKQANIIEFDADDRGLMQASERARRERGVIGCDSYIIVNNILEMQSLDDDLPQLFPPEANRHSVNFSSLLEGGDSDRHCLFGEGAQEAKEDHRGQRTDPDHEGYCGFNLRTIEKQDEIRQIPEQFDEEQPEEDPLHFGLYSKNGLFDGQLLQSRSPVFNRTAYLQEGRKDKIARYLDKKGRRVWSRKISYNCRKVVADKRERRNGRFVKKQQSNLNNLRNFSSRRSREDSLQRERQHNIASSFEIDDCYQ